MDQTAGPLVYEYPLALPPGRNGLTPDIKLTYNSQTTQEDTLYGFGWTDTIPYIARINRKGSGTMYTDNYFLSSIDGELVSTGTNTYAAKVEKGSFNKYTLSGNIWTVADKDGTTYTFGSDATGRQDDPNDSTRVYKWMLQDQRDTNNNYVKYAYFKDSGQIYPSQITYTGNGTTDGPFTLTFQRITRNDVLTTDEPAFAVTTNYIINEIDAKVNGSLVRKFVLATSTGDNGKRSNLTSVTETAYDESGVATTKPATTFNYQTSTKTWMQNTSWAIPSGIYFGRTHDGQDGGARLVDVNGDGLPDIVVATENNGSPVTQAVYINTGNGWSLDTSWTIPSGVYFVDKYNGYEQGIELVDVNGDGLPDFVVSSTGNSVKQALYLNNGHGWTQNTSWTFPPAYFSNTFYGTDWGARLVDINGDGLPDFVVSSTGNTVNQGVYINTGSTWVQDTTWTLPAAYFVNTFYGFEWGAQIVDVNGDGLADIVVASVNGQGTYTQAVYINNGHGFTQDTTWTLPTNLAFVSTYSGIDQGVRLVDVNNDGLPDLFQSSYNLNSGVWKQNIYINTGHGWTLDSGYTIPSFYFADTYYGWGGATATDISGDNLTDIAVLYYDENANTYDQRVFMRNGVKADLLSGITFNTGGSSTITYQASALYKSGSTYLNPKLPFDLDTVQQISINDGSGNISNAAYSYQNGAYYFSDPFNRKFAGFGEVVKTDPAGNVTNTFYHQGNGPASVTSTGEYYDDVSKIGRIYRLEQYDNANHLFTKSLNYWDKAALSGGNTFVKLIQSVAENFDGGASHKDKAETYAYDNTTGNQTQKIEYGQVNGNDDGSFTDVGGDLFTTTYAYASGGNVIGLPDDVTVANQGGSKVKESKYLYDNAAFGSVTKGNLTEEDDWISGSTYAVTKKAYDGTYGLATQFTDPNNHSTTYTYESLNLYPATAKNALNQQTSYTYDYQYGKVDQTTDPNGFNFKNVYDGFGRPTSQQQPDLTTPTTLVNKTTYVYVDTSNAVSVQKKDWMDGTNSIATYSYFDGLNRPIQQRSSAEDAGNYNVKDFKYSNLGLLSQESLPYVSSGSGKTSPTTTAALLITYGYDALLRITSVANTLGTTSSVYSPWKVTVTDPNSHSKDLIKDAYDNLAQVNEYNGSTYTTTYSYDYLKDLTNITDALGNVRNFTYDGLGRRLSAQDLHPASSVSFGTWTYVFDNAGNLTQTNDPNGNQINYVYDVLNRITNEKLGTVNKVTYAYDTCTDGVGRLCTVTNPSVSTANTYNALGFLVKAVSTIGSTPYETDYAYDRQQHQTLITNPDSSQIQYTYNLAGLPETVQRKESTDSALKNVVTNFDYSPQNDVSVTSYANGAGTTNTYDSTKLYRVTHKVTALSGANLQDISYTYDPVGNITQITDNSATDTKKNISYGYDNLNRLSSYTVTSAVNGNNHSETYSYDALGNITSKSDQGTYTYGGTGFPNPDAVTALGSNAFTYDNNGNLLTGSNLTNAWDYNNRLTQSVIGSGQTAVTVTYGYDQSGERVTYSNGTTSTVYPTKLYNVTGTNPTKHIFANGQIIATITGRGAGATAAYVNTDRLTGANVITDDAGTTKEVLDYYPFGASRLDEQTGFNEQRKFDGHEFDADTSLSYQDARYYNPAIGRWLSEDAYVISPKVDLTDPQQLDAYSYIRNNPVNGIDPDGNNFFDYLGGFLQGTLASFGSNISDTISYLNPFRAEIAYAPSSETSMLPPTKLSEAHINGDRANGTTAGLDFGDKFSQVVEVGSAVAAPELDEAAVAKGLQGGDEIYLQAGQHVFDLHPERYPGLSASDIARIAKDTNLNADVTASVDGIHPNTGAKVNKQYYGNSTTGQVFVNTNIGSPTVFPTSNPAAYIQRQIPRDVKRYGVK